MGKKKFIDKKNSATFQLFARDYSDPNYSADGPAGDRVFVRVDANPYSAPNTFSDDQNGAVSFEDPDAVFADAEDDYDDGYFEERRRTTALPDKVRKEILELGFPDDGYNYLDHLREIKNAGGGSAYYENAKAKLDPVPVDVKVCAFFVQFFFSSAWFMVQLLEKIISCVSDFCSSLLMNAATLFHTREKLFYRVFRISTTRSCTCPKECLDGPDFKRTLSGERGVFFQNLDNWLRGRTDG